MPPNDGDKLNRVEELKEKLFSKNYETEIEHRDKFTRVERGDIPDAWVDENKANAPMGDYPEKFFMRTRVFKNFFLFSLVFFLLTIAYASYTFFAGGNTVSNDNIDISIVGNNFTIGGEELNLIVGITNRNSSALDLVDLILEYPKNSPELGPGLSAAAERTRMSLGTIPAGAVRSENLKVVLFGEQGKVIPLKVSIEYRVEGSNAIFVKEKPYEVTVSSSPLNLSIEAPATLSPNQEVTLNVKLSLNATKPAEKMLLKADYPVGFQFKAATPMPSLGNNVWSLGDLVPGALRTISITGQMLDVFDGEEKTFHISSGMQSPSNKYLIDVVSSSLSHTIAIAKPFIEAEIFVNGRSERDQTSYARNTVNVQIGWANNLDTKINDLSIRAKISGNAVSRKSINAEQGFYNSSEDAIIWDKNSYEQFREVSPGDSGSVNFSFTPLPLYSASGGILANPSIDVQVSISGKQLVEGYASKDLENSASSSIRLISEVGFLAKALHYSGPFKNTGPVPPQAEKETTYTAVWSLSNTSNNISKAVLRSSLPAWVRFVGPVSPAEADLKYNASKKEIVWNIGNIPRGTGITTLGKSVSFQVALTPSLSQVGTSPVLLNEATLTGHDDFANVDVRVNKISLRTVLAEDPGFPPNGGQVVE